MDRPGADRDLLDFAEVGAPEHTKKRRRPRLRVPMSRARWAVAGVGALVLAGSPFAVAAGTGDPLLGGTRNPGNNLSKELTRETQIIGDIDENEGGVAKNTGGYVTRQSNKSDTGGGAIYGCRAPLGKSSKDIADPAKSTPCVRANNLSDGKAFGFQATHGKLVGIMQVGPSLFEKHPDAIPFITNATGIALGLNADQVDGMDGADVIAKARAHDGLDADTVDGMTPAQIAALGSPGSSQASCPDGTTATGGICVQTAPNAADTFANAAAACASGGSRLPTAAELVAVRGTSGIDLGTGEMTSDVYHDTGLVGADGFGYVTIADDGTFGGTAVTAKTAYRCVTD